MFFGAMAWQVCLLSNAPTARAAVGIAMTLPQLLLLIAGGVVSDRVDRRKAMIAADVVRGLAIGAIGVLAISGRLELGSMIALVVVYGGATAFFGPAYEALVPEIVPPEMLTEANGLDQFMRPAASRLAGPALGGMIIAAAGVGPAFLVDAATFACSAVCVGRILPRRAGGGAGRLSLEEVWAGMRFVRAHVWLWGTLLGAAASYLLFVGPSEVLLPFVVKHDMHGGAQALGLVLAAGGVGALFAAALAAQRGMPRRHITWMYVTWSLATLAIAGLGLAVASWQLALASLLFNGFEAAGTVWWATTKARLVPPELRGRVSSLDWFISIGLVPLSYAFTAPAVAAIGARATLIAVGSAGALITLAPLFLRGMRDVERGGMALDRPSAPVV
ncbi:MAG: MFS transporter [Actinomycetota bacterium]|nr:MFS transporter [Actinomycetota bacterium]